MPMRHLPGIFFQLTALAAQAGCLLLLVLARYGQTPPESLPVPTILFFGAMLSGPLHSLARSFSRREFGLHLAAAALLGLLLNLGLQASPDYSAGWLLAPATALLLTALLRLPAVRTGNMLSAMTVYGACTVLANYTLDSFLPVG